ncbi:MAG: hypothetical protein V3T70_00235, partial [Phycisphaerae bacterium]
AGSLPTSVEAFWDQLRNLITLAEGTLAAICGIDLFDWHNALFVYLLVCMSVRMAPLPDNLRGHLLAVLLTGVLAGIVGTFTGGLADALHRSWPIITLAVATLLLLFMASLTIRGVIGLGRMLSKG